MLAPKRRNDIAPASARPSDRLSLAEAPRILALTHPTGAAREAERSLSGGTAAENQRLIGARRAEYVASPSGSVHTACM